MKHSILELLANVFLNITESLSQIKIRKRCESGRQQPNIQISNRMSEFYKVFCTDRVMDQCVVLLELGGILRNIITSGIGLFPKLIPPLWCSNTDATQLPEDKVYLRCNLIWSSIIFFIYFENLLWGNYSYVR